MILITFNGVEVTETQLKIIREHKGKSQLLFPSDYVIIDIETTGLEPSFDEIIEIGAIKVINNEITEKFSTLVKPIEEIDDFITNLTGITNEMLSTAPSLSSVLPKFNNFIGSNILVGHNVNFDINFLYDSFMSTLEIPLSNNFIDTLRMARRALPELQHHRLKDLVKYFKLNNISHRALIDCECTYTIFQKLISTIVNDYNSLDIFLETVKKTKKKLNANDVKTDKTEFDTDHLLYNKVCVFTGILEKMPRKDAMQMVVDVGGICGNSVTKQTNYLILGNNDYCSSIKDGKSSKQKKAELLKLKGQEIDIISENIFYDIILEENY